MGRFTVNAKNVNQIVSADVINAPVISNSQLSSLSKKERDDLIEQLLNALQTHATTLSESAKPVSQEDVRKLGAETSAIIKQVTAEPQAAHKFDAERIFEKFRSCFGSATDVLLNAVKLAQLFGIGG
jgi:hypothetical protein